MSERGGRLLLPHCYYCFCAISVVSPSFHRKHEKQSHGFVRRLLSGRRIERSWDELFKEASCEESTQQLFIVCFHPCFSYLLPRADQQLEPPWSDQRERERWMESFSLRIHASCQDSFVLIRCDVRVDHDAVSSATTLNGVWHVEEPDVVERWTTRSVAW